MLKTLEDLVTLARERKKNPVEGSYTNKLLEDETLSKEKVLEEIGELIESVEKNIIQCKYSGDCIWWGWDIRSLSRWNKIRCQCCFGCIYISLWNLFY